MKLSPHFIKATAAVAIVLDGTSASTFRSPYEKLESQLQLPSLMKEKASSAIRSATTSNKNNLRHAQEVGVGAPIDPRSWDQVGPNIQPVGMNGDGEDIILWFGWSVAMSDDAKTVAIGSPATYSSNLEERFRGIVQVFEETGFPPQWTKKGSDLKGTDDYDFIGYSLDMSAGGDAIVINSPPSGNFTGLVQVYKYVSDWEQVGGDITGVGEMSFFGVGSSNIALSADAETLIVGSPFFNNFTGVVHEYKLGPLTSAWNMIKIYQGGSPFDMFGYTLDATSDASTLIVGAPGYDGGKGLVQAYQDGSLISNTTGYNELDFMGTSISLSEDASTVAILSSGFDNEKGLLQVFKNEVVVGSATGDNYDGSIESVKLSGDGSTVAVGTTEYVQVFKYSSDNWEQAGGDLIIYHDLEVRSGGVPPVALSEDGNTIVKGYPEGTDTNFDEAGFAKVYILSQTSNPTPAPSEAPSEAPTSTSEDSEDQEDDSDCDDGLLSIFSRVQEFFKN